MRLTGYDAAQGKITDASGAEMVFDTSPRPSPRSRRRGRRNAGEVAAAWAFSGLLAHTLRWTTVAQTHAGGVCAVHAARCITTPASSWRCLRTATRVHGEAGGEEAQPVPRGVEEHRRALRDGGGGGAVSCGPVKTHPVISCRTCGCAAGCHAPARYPWRVEPSDAVPRAGSQCDRAWLGRRGWGF